MRRTWSALRWQWRKRVVERPEVLTLANGVRFKAYPDCGISSALQYADWPDHDELQFCRKVLRRGDAVVDVGANVGHFSLLLSDVVGPENLWCFEPTPVAWRRLKENFELNGWPTGHVLPVAVGREPGVIAFPDLEHPDTTNSAASRRPGVRTVDVKVVCLDDIVQQLDGCRVGLLKVDVEGFEREVFSGARRFLTQCRPRMVLFESLDRRLDPAIGEILAGADYVVFKVEADRPMAAPLDANNLFAVHRPELGAIDGLQDLDPTAPTGG